MHASDSTTAIWKTTRYPYVSARTPEIVDATLLPTTSKVVRAAKWEAPTLLSTFDIIHAKKQVESIPPAFGSRAVVGLILTYKMGETLGDIMFKPLLLDLGIPAGTIGVWSGVYSMGFSIAGSLAGGYIARMMPLLSAISWTLGIRVVPQIMRLWVAAAFVSTTSSPETPLLDHGFIVTTMCAEAF
eukprot:gene7497-16706_t